MANKIYYKGKSYGEGGTAEVKPVEAAEDEIVTGDGEDWLKGSGIKIEDSKVLLNDLFVEGEENPKIESIQLWNDDGLKINTNKESSYFGEAQNFFTNSTNYTIGSITIKNLTDDSKSKEIELDLDNISFNGKPYQWYQLTYQDEDTKKTVYSAQTLIASITKQNDGSISIYAADGSINLANVTISINYFLEKDNTYEIIINTTSQKATFNITNCKEEISRYYDKELKGIKLVIDNVIADKKTITTDESLILNSKAASLILKGNAAVEIKDDATVSVREGAHLSFGNNTRVVADGNSKVILHDGCYLDLGGDAYNNSPYGPSYWDGVTTPARGDTGGKGGLPFTPGLVMHQSASIQADGAAALVLHQAPWVEFAGNGSFVFGGADPNSATSGKVKYLTPMCHIINGEYYLGGDYSRYTSNGYQRVDDYPMVFLNSGSYCFNSELREDGKTYAPFMNFNGGGGITFNGSESSWGYPGLTRDGEEANKLYPQLICEQTGFMFCGCVNANQSRSRAYGSGANWDVFWDAGNFLHEKSQFPRFKIGAATQIMIEGGDARGRNYGNRTWIKVGPSGGSENNVHSVILNICNNPTIEFNHDASFMMKGYDDSGYYDHLYPQSKEVYHNGPIFKMLGKPYFSMKDNVVIDFHNNRSPGNPTDYYLNFGLTSPQSTESDYQNTDANNTCILTSRQIRKDLNYIWQSEIERGHAKDYLHLSVKPTETLAISSLTQSKKSLLTDENLNHLFSEESMNGDLHVAPPEGYSKVVVNSESQITLVDKDNTVLATVTKDENGIISVSSSLDTYAPTLCFRSSSYDPTSFSAAITTASDATYTLEMPISSSCILNDKIYSSYMPIGTLTSTEEERTLTIQGNNRIFENDYTETYLGSMNRYASSFTLGLDGAFGSNSNQCFLSVGDSAKVKLRGDLVFTSDTVTNSDNTHTTSITFTGAEDEGSITFTIAELKALKALLS